MSEKFTLTSPIKILHIIKSLGRGGAEMLLPEAIKIHDQSKFEFHCIYFLPWKDQMVDALQKAGAVVTCFSASNNILLMMQAERVIRYIIQHQIDVVHCHLPWAGFLGRYIHMRIGIPTIYTEHNKQERYHWATYWLNKLTFKWQNQVIAVSDDVKNSILKHIKPKIGVKTILNGVNTDFFQRSRQRDQDLFQLAHALPPGVEEGFKLAHPNFTSQSIQLELGEDSQPSYMVVGTVAVFRFQKRLKEWLEVFAAAKKKQPNLLGLIVGAGPLDAEIRSHRTALGLEEYVLMPGLQTNTRDWYNAMDIFMMTSSFEGLPVALLEAMSMECAIVSTAAGGIGEVIQDGESGKLASVENWLLLVDHLGELASQEERQRLAKAARIRILDKFSMQRMVRELEEAYRDVRRFGLSDVRTIE